MLLQFQLHLLVQCITDVTQPQLQPKASTKQWVRGIKPLRLSSLDSLLATPKKLSCELTAVACGFRLKHVEYPKLFSKSDAFVSTVCLVNCYSFLFLLLLLILN